MIETTKRADERRPTERALLVALYQGLCQAPPAPSSARARQLLLAQVKEHGLREPEHQVIFEALENLTAQGIEIGLAALNAALTRMGFPDMEVEWLLGTHTAAEGGLPCKLDGPRRLC